MSGLMSLGSSPDVLQYLVALLALHEVDTRDHDSDKGDTHRACEKPQFGLLAHAERSRGAHHEHSRVHAQKRLLRLLPHRRIRVVATRELQQF